MVVCLVPVFHLNAFLCCPCGLLHRDSGAPLSSERALMSVQHHTAAGMCKAGIQPWAGDQEILQFKCLKVLAFLVELDVEMGRVV